MRTLAVVVARCGSKRIPHKNVQLVGHYTLVERALRSASGTCADLNISTDCIEVVRKLGADACLAFERRCGPDGPMVDVLLEALAERSPHTKEPFDAVACIQPTSPFRTREDIKGCIALLERNPWVMSAVTVDESTGLRSGAVYVTRVPMLKDGKVFDEHSLTYPVPHERSLDVNLPADLEEARRIAKEKGW